jgi:hypothetical protein
VSRESEARELGNRESGTRNYDRITYPSSLFSISAVGAAVSQGQAREHKRYDHKRGQNEPILRWIP